MPLLLDVRLHSDKFFYVFRISCCFIHYSGGCIYEDFFVQSSGNQAEQVISIPSHLPLIQYLQTYLLYRTVLEYTYFRSILLKIGYKLFFSFILLHVSQFIGNQEKLLGLNMRNTMI